MFTNILVPLDGSALSEQALPMAQHLARSSDTSLHLLQVISLRPELEALRGSGSESVTVLEMAQDAARRAKPRRPGQGLSGRPRGQLQRRSPCHHGPAGRCCRRAHLAYAQEQAIDLIVMSTHGHSGFKRFFLERDRPGHPCRPDACAGRARLVSVSQAALPHPARRALKTGGPPWPASIPWILKIDTCALKACIDRGYEIFPTHPLAEKHTLK